MATTDVIIHSDKVKTVPSIVGMAQCIRACLLDDLSSIPRTHIVQGGERIPLCCPLTSTHTLWNMHTHIQNEPINGGETPVIQ